MLVTSFINHVKALKKMPSKVIYHFPFLKWWSDFKSYKNIKSITENMILSNFNNPWSYFQMDYKWS